MGQCLETPKVLNKPEGVIKFQGKPLNEFLERFQFTSQVLGKGSFSVVRLAIKKETEEKVAVKALLKNGLKRRQLKRIYDETKIMKKLRHENIVKMHDYFEDESSFLLVLEFAAGGDLFYHIGSRDRFTEEDVKTITRTLAGALQYCSSLGITHRDIKPENILLMERVSAEKRNETDLSKIVIADFGFATQMEPSLKEFDLLQTQCGTRSYIAPEVLSGKSYNYKCDIWSLGVVIYILLCGTNPFYSGSYEQTRAPYSVRKDIINESVIRIKQGRWEFSPEDMWRQVSREAKDFLLHILKKDKDKRYGYQAIMSHSWLSGDKKNDTSIDLSNLKRFNVRRKMLAAKKASMAALKFKDLMESKGIVMSDLIDEEETQAKEIELAFKKSQKNRDVKQELIASVSTDVFFLDDEDITVPN